MSKKIEDLLKETTIEGLKRADAVVCSDETTVDEAVRLMQKEQSGYVVAIDAEKKVVGIFTEKDITLHVLLKEPDMSVPVTKFIKHPLRALTLSDTVGQAIDVMHTYEYRHIALIDKQGKLAGVVSARAIIRFLAENFPAEVLNLPPRSGQVSKSREGG